MCVSVFILYLCVRQYSLVMLVMMGGPGSSVVILMMMEGLGRGPLEDCAFKTLTNAVGKSIMIDLRSTVINLCQKLCSTWHLRYSAVR